jgi:hypothetical protein
MTLQIDLDPLSQRRLAEQADRRGVPQEQLARELIERGLSARTGDAWDVLEQLTGSVDAPEDWSVEHNHYLYGAPKIDSTQE